MLNELAESEWGRPSIALEGKTKQDTITKPNNSGKDSSQDVKPAINNAVQTITPSQKEDSSISNDNSSSVIVDKPNETNGSITNYVDYPIATDTIPVALIEPPVVINNEIKQDSFPNFFSTSYSKTLEPKQKLEDADSWILPFLLICFFFLALLNTLYPKEIMVILHGVVKKGGLKKLEELDNNIVWRCLLLFLLLFLIVSPVFMFQTASYFDWNTAFLPYLSPYFQLLFIGAGLLGFKILFIGLIGNIFFVQEEAAGYVTGMVVMNAILAAVLIPISLAIKLSPLIYTGYILSGGLVILGVCYLYSVVNAMVTGLRSPNLSLFHLFLYFCTLEILPVFIIIKTVKTLI